LFGKKKKKKKKRTIYTKNLTNQFSTQPTNQIFIRHFLILFIGPTKKKKKKSSRGKCE